MLALMTTTKTARLSERQAAWLARTSTATGISENKIMGMLIDRAMLDGLQLTFSFSSEPDEGPGSD